MREVRNPHDYIAVSHRCPQSFDRQTILWRLAVGQVRCQAINAYANSVSEQFLFCLHPTALQQGPKMSKILTNAQAL